MFRSLARHRERKPRQLASFGSTVNIVGMVSRKLAICQMYARLVKALSLLIFSSASRYNSYKQSLAMREKES